MTIHIFYGYSKHEPDDDETCMYCKKHAELMAYTYFGAPVCGECWDSYWRLSEEGECGPPFDEINRKSSGEWLG